MERACHDHEELLVTEYHIISEDGSRLAGGLASLQHALQIAQMYAEALQIYRIEPVLACIKDVETGLWCAPDEWPHAEDEP